MAWFAALVASVGSTAAAASRPEAATATPTAERVTATEAHLAHAATRARRCRHGPGTFPCTFPRCRVLIAPLEEVASFAATNKKGPAFVWPILHNCPRRTRSATLAWRPWWLLRLIGPLEEVTLLALRHWALEEGASCVRALLAHLEWHTWLIAKARRARLLHALAHVVARQRRTTTRRHAPGRFISPLKVIALFTLCFAAFEKGSSHVWPLFPNS
mmetsp:Transcript_80024/g.158536  ORF Transcript_80024/g.158536 Transcript_80024/m.158536 type:complete len:216 (-) Transcript_80024:1314-1961(-)